MKRKSSDHWQPSLDLRPRKQEGAQPSQPVEPHVEYDPPPKARQRELEIQRRPEPPKAPDDLPWWSRAKQVEEAPRQTSSVQWGQSWLRLLRGEGWTVDMAPGKRALLESAVRGLEFHAGVVEASHGGGKEKPQRVQLRLAPLTHAEWARLARQVVEGESAQTVRDELARGLVPLAVIDAADVHSLALLPRRFSQVNLACTCGGARLPCDHVLAVNLVFARRLDDEPLSLLRFRGLPGEELVELVARVEQEARERATGILAAQAAIDPFSARTGPEPDWSLLERPAPARAPLPAPDVWRVRESFDALVRRLVARLAR